jgi:nucleoside 2-deoxyribosyltransferase
MRIYLAGPLFTTAEREFNARIGGLLRRAGHEVFLPQEMEDRQAPVREAFEHDVAAIDGADVVVANMDGPDPDSGTCWECGYAFGKKPIVLFRTDFRAGDESGKAPYNFMLTESATRHLLLPFADGETVARELLRTLGSL